MTPCTFSHFFEIYEVTVKELISLPEKNNACEENEDGMEFKTCLENYVAKRINCTPPWNKQDLGANTFIFFPFEAVKLINIS